MQSEKKARQIRELTQHIKFLSACFSTYNAGPLYHKVQPVHFMLTVSLPSDFGRVGTEKSGIAYLRPHFPFF